MGVAPENLVSPIGMGQIPKCANRDIAKRRMFFAKWTAPPFTLRQMQAPG
jgi:hypothetical protein